MGSRVAKARHGSGVSPSPQGPVYSVCRGGRFHPESPTRSGTYRSSAISRPKEAMRDLHTQHTILKEKTHQLTNCHLDESRVAYILYYDYTTSTQCILSAYSYRYSVRTGTPNLRTP